jgi:hypothetical protein
MTDKPKRPFLLITGNEHGEYRMTTTFGKSDSKTWWKKRMMVQRDWRREGKQI